MARKDEVSKTGQGRSGSRQDEQAKGAATPPPPKPSGEEMRGSSTSESTRPPRQPGRMPLPD